MMKFSVIKKILYLLIPLMSILVIISIYNKNNSDSDRTEDTLSESKTPAFDITSIPEYNGSPYIEINNNIPFFTDSEKRQEDVFESYSELDLLGRCGVACANIGKELMPNEPRGEIGAVKPSGWHTVKYNDIIEGNYLYNRCHLIAFALAGENTNEKNLITGTRYLNVNGMLPFENKVIDYINIKSNHVLYRVTPIFENDNLVASGVLMEAWSIEDSGAGISFCIYCYNVQPGIIIDYKTGDSQKNTAEQNNDNATTMPCDYIVNKHTYKIHKPDCDGVKDMAEHNKWYYSGNIDDLINEGYNPCKRCLKEYSTN